MLEKSAVSFYGQIYTQWCERFNPVLNVSVFISKAKTKILKKNIWSKKGNGVDL